MSKEIGVMLVGGGLGNIQHTKGSKPSRDVGDQFRLNLDFISGRVRSTVRFSFLAIEFHVSVCSPSQESHVDIEARSLCRQ